MTRFLTFTVAVVAIVAIVFMSFLAYRSYAGEALFGYPAPQPVCSACLEPPTFRDIPPQPLYDESDGWIVAPGTNEPIDILKAIEAQIETCDAMFITEEIRQSARRGTPSHKFTVEFVQPKPDGDMKLAPFCEGEGCRKQR